MIHHNVSRVVLNNFKRYFNIEKNSEITGRVPVVRRSKNNKTSNCFASKNIILIDKWVEEMQLFLLTAPYWCEKIFVIAPTLKSKPHRNSTSVSV